jgi:hypothetical protein
MAHVLMGMAHVLTALSYKAITRQICDSKIISCSAIPKV